MLRIVLAEVGSDDHPRVAEVAARALRDAGHEVVYSGRQGPEQIVATAIQEDADLIAYAGADAGTLARVTALLAEREADDIAVFAPAEPSARIVEQASHAATDG